MEELGRLVRAAHGLDRSWWERAKCRQWKAPEGSPWAGRHYVGPSIWQVDHNQTVCGVAGAVLIDVALMVCMSCDAQYDCATYAVRAEVTPGGTWAMSPAEMRWLQANGGLDVVEAARSTGTPIQVEVRRRRTQADA